MIDPSQLPPQLAQLMPGVKEKQAEEKRQQRFTHLGKMTTAEEADAKKGAGGTGTASASLAPPSVLQTNVGKYGGKEGFLTKLDEAKADWKKATEAREKARVSVGTVGSDPGNTMAEAYRAERIARNKYLALLAVAVPCPPGTPPFLSEGDWEELANEAGGKDVEAFKNSEPYKGFANIMTAEQYQRAGQLAASDERAWYEVRKTLKTAADTSTIAEMYDDKVAEQYLLSSRVAVMLPIVAQQDLHEYNQHHGTAPAPAPAAALIDVTDKEKREQAIADAKKLSDNTAVAQFHHGIQTFAGSKVKRGWSSIRGEHISERPDEIPESTQTALAKRLGIPLEDGKPKSDLVVNGKTFKSVVTTSMKRISMGYVMGGPLASMFNVVFGEKARMQSMENFMTQWISGMAQHNGVSEYDVVDCFFSNAEKREVWRETQASKDARGKKGADPKLQPQYERLEEGNENLTKPEKPGEKGKPINKFHVSSIPMTGGSSAAVRALADLCALGRALEFEVEVHTDLIAKNAQQQARGQENITTIASKVADEWDHHSESLIQEASARLEPRLDQLVEKYLTQELSAKYSGDELKQKVGEEMARLRQNPEELKRVRKNAFMLEKYGPNRQVEQQNSAVQVQNNTPPKSGATAEATEARTEDAKKAGAAPAPSPGKDASGTDASPAPSTATDADLVFNTSVIGGGALADPAAALTNGLVLDTHVKRTI